MTERSENGEYYVQVGLAALRSATGEFLPSVPLFIRVRTDQVNENTGLAQSEKDLCSDISGLFAERFGHYVQKERRKNYESDY